MPRLLIPGCPCLNIIGYQEMVEVVDNNDLVALVVVGDGFLEVPMYVTSERVPDQL